MTSPGRGVQVVGYRRVLTGGVRVDPAVAGPTAARARLFWPALVVETLGLVDGCGAPLASLAVDRGTVVQFADLDLEAQLGWKVNAGSIETPSGASFTVGDRGIWPAA